MVVVLLFGEGRGRGDVRGSKGFCIFPEVSITYLLYLLVTTRLPAFLKNLKFSSSFWVS